MAELDERKRYVFGPELRDALAGAISDVGPRFDLALIQTPGSQAPSAAEDGALGASLATALAARIPGASLPPLDVRRITPSLFLLGHIVLSTGRLLYQADRRARVAVEVEILRRYLDTAWLRETYRQRRHTHAA